MAKSKRSAANRTRLKKTAPALVIGKVPLRGRNLEAAGRRSRGTLSSPLPPRRLKNSARRNREYLTPEEIEKLLQAAGRLGRHGARDRTLLLIAYRHGLRVSELVTLRWDQVDLKAGVLHVARLKNGVPSTHPIRSRELRSLRDLKRDYPN